MVGGRGAVHSSIKQPANYRSSGRTCPFFDTGLHHLQYTPIVSIAIGTLLSGLNAESPTATDTVAL